MHSPAIPVHVHAQLPPELWIRVFFWATFSPARDVRSLLAVPLFDGITHHEHEAHVQQALHVKAVLALVCRQWRALSEQYLYEDIRVRHGKRILAEVLERSRKECPRALGKGKYVSRIVLPQMQEKSAGYGHNRHWADKETSRIIKCCPNLLVLSRYYNMFVKTGGDSDAQSGVESNPISKIDEDDCCSIYDPSLPSIRRLDWSNGVMIDGRRQPTICAVPSALWSAQHLEVLSLSGENYFWGPMELQSLSAAGRGAILLPKVHTLRVGSVYAFGVPGVSNYTFALPALRRIILDRGEALHRLIECVFALPPTSPHQHAGGPHVTALEIGTPHWRFARSDYISTLIRHYPTAESLHYPVFFVRPLRWRRLRDNGLSYGPNDRHTLFGSLRHIGLHAEPNPELLFSDDSENADAIWSHLYAHARALLGSTSPTLLESRLPGVRSITLHGLAWLPLVADMRFHLILDLARMRNAEILADNKSVASVLADTLFDYGSDLILDWVRML